MSYKQYIQEKKKRKPRTETPDAEVELRKAKAEEKRKKLVPVRISRSTMIMVDKKTAKDIKKQNRQRVLNP
jgi:hypothetical protein